MWPGFFSHFEGDMNIRLHFYAYVSPYVGLCHYVDLSFGVHREGMLFCALNFDYMLNIGSNIELRSCLGLQHLFQHVASSFTLRAEHVSILEISGASQIDTTFLTFVYMLSEVCKISKMKIK